MAENEYINRYAAAHYVNYSLGGYGRSEMRRKTGNILRPFSPVADWLVALSLIDRDGDYSDPTGWEWSHVWEVVREWMVGDREE